MESLESLESLFSQILRRCIKEKGLIKSVSRHFIKISQVQEPAKKKKYFGLLLSVTKNERKEREKGNWREKVQDGRH